VPWSRRENRRGSRRSTTRAGLVGASAGVYAGGVTAEVPRLCFLSSELFGLKSPYSDDSVSLHKQLAGLDGRILAGETLPPDAARRRADLQDTLPNDSTADLGSVLAALRARR
jgi:hypothetical protein